MYGRPALYIASMKKKGTALQELSRRLGSASNFSIVERKKGLPPYVGDWKIISQRALKANETTTITQRDLLSRRILKLALETGREGKTIAATPISINRKEGIVANENIRIIPRETRTTPNALQITPNAREPKNP